MTTLNASNYTVGQAEIWFSETVVASNNSTPLDELTSFGNITAAEISDDITYAEHFISYKGSRRKDKELAVTKTISIPFTFDELNDENIRKFMMGKTVTASKTLVMDKNYFEGRAIINFQTSVGNNFIYVIPSCSLKSDGGLAFNAEDWMNANFVIEVLHNDTYKEGGDPTASLAPYGYINFDQLGLTTLRNVVDNWVNCWKLLTMLRQSAAKLTKKAIDVGKKVQRLIGEDALPISLTRVPSIS